MKHTSSAPSGAPDERSFVPVPRREAERVLAGGNPQATALYFYARVAGRPLTREDCVRCGVPVDAYPELCKLFEALGLSDITCAAPPEDDASPTYTSGEINRQLADDEIFQALVDYTKAKLNKILTRSDLARLLGIYDHLGLSAGVIMLLISYCAEQDRRRQGEGARTGMWRVEREAYRWQRAGITSERAAEEYIREKTAADERIARLAAILQIQGRAPTATEEKFLSRWADMGFQDELIYLAYDKTVVNTGSLKWSYMNTILNSWHEKGYRTPEDVTKKDRRRPAGESAVRSVSPAGGANAAERLRRKRQSGEQKEDGNGI